MYGEPDAGPDERARIVQETLHDRANRSVEDIATEYDDRDSALARRLAVADAECSPHIAEIAREGYPPLKDAFEGITCPTLVLKADADEREALIDRLHVDMGTDPDGITDFNKIDNGISNYSEGTYSYNGNNNHWMIKGNIEDAVANDNPPLLNMTNGPYTKDDQWINGHSVTVVGYRKGSGYFYHKVHNGYNTPPDRVSNGNWTDAFVTRITKQ